MADGAPAIELEHAVGFSALKGGLKYHPNGREYLYAVGASIVICDFNDQHNQVRARREAMMRGCTRPGSAPP